jgi:uncharacterized protein (PEP-CTERM system associated)
MQRQAASRRADRWPGERRLPGRSKVGRRARRAALPFLVCGLAAPAFAADAPDAEPRPRFRVETSIGIQETLTNNVELVQTDRRSDLITQVSPSIRLVSLAGPVRGFLDYSPVGYLYARDSSLNNIQQALSAAGTAEAIEKWAFVDASASITQQNISPFGKQSADNALGNANRTEVAWARVSPYLRGKLGGFADYEARATVSATRSKDSPDDSTTVESLLRAGSDSTSSAFLGWSAALSHQAIDFSTTGKQQNDRLTGVMTFAVMPELRLSARAGREVNDLVTIEKQTYNTYGAGVTWVPSERTKLDAIVEHRFFGTSHSVNFEYRSPRSVLQFTDKKDLATDSSNNFNNGPQRTVFDLLFQQFASLAPDPVQRAALVDAFLQNNGLTRTTLAQGGFLTSNVTVQSNQNMSFALLGVRSTLLISAFRSGSSLLTPVSNAAGNLTSANTLLQTGASINLSHRLTPLSALSASLARTRTSGGVGDQHTELRSLTVTWTNQLAERVDLSLSARRSSFDSATDPYNESAVLANLRMRF